MVLSRAKRKVELRIDSTMTTHFQPVMVRTKSSGGGCCFSGSVSSFECSEGAAAVSFLVFSSAARWFVSAVSPWVDPLIELAVALFSSGRSAGAGSSFSGSIMRDWVCRYSTRPPAQMSGCFESTSLQPEDERADIRFQAPPSASHAYLGSQGA